MFQRNADKAIKERETFTQAVYEVVRLIPFGRATSYGIIAKIVGFPTMSRRVGKVMSRSNSSERKLPAHRVVNNQGILSGKAAFGPSDEMQKLLEAEGIMVINNRIKNWKKICWNPLEEF